MSLISPNFDVKLIIFFPNFGQGPFLKIAGKGPVYLGWFRQVCHTMSPLESSHFGKSNDGTQHIIIRFLMKGLSPSVSSR